MRGRALLFVAAVLLSRGLHAQVVSQATLPPTVTAESASWYVSGGPIEINGERYYQKGPVRFFNGQEMVRSGSYSGIPLYINPMLGPNIVLVPLSGGRMQPYERPEPGVVLATNGTPSPEPVAPGATGSTSLPAAAGTSGRSVVTPVRPVTTLRRPTGLNSIWIPFDGHRWYAGGKAIPYDAAVLTEVGKYRGWSVYVRKGDRSTIYIPGAPGRLMPYKRR